jgi:acetylornithine deacetylase/succinyl-diaminopimelate desuccinylase-like protein
MTFQSSLRIPVSLLSVTLSFNLFIIATAQVPEQDDNAAKALEIYRNIISINTAYGYGNVPQMAEYLAGQLKTAGFTAEDIRILPLEDTAAMVVHYRGDGRAGKKPILFLAHMDVVDASADDWGDDPFRLKEDDEYFLGRGTSDNKYGVMNLTQSFMRLKSSGFIPSRDLILVFSGDEETSQDTTNMLVTDFRDLIDAEFALNSDSGGGSLAADGRALAYSVQSAEKTYATFEISARNPGGHSARPRRDNAIYELSEAILKIREHRFPVQSNAILSASLQAEGMQLGGDLGEALMAFADNPNDQDAVERILKDEDYDHIISTTCVATMIRGGEVENGLPQNATVTVNCRIFPGTEVNEIQSTLHKIIDNEHLEIAPLDDYFASPASEPRSDVTLAVTRAVHQRYPNLKLVPSMSSGYTDAAYYRRAGIPTWGVSSDFIGPGGSNAHGTNERIPKATFYDGLDHWIIIIRELAGR